METAQRLAQTWVATGRDEEIEETAAAINNGDIKLLHVVQALGEYLTSEEDLLRTKGVQYLASVVGKCSPDKLNRQSVKVLIAFFTSKLEDTETIVPALNGILNLTSLPAFISDDAVTICEALFANVKMQALVQPQRHVVFSIFDSLIARYRQALKDMENDFLTGYIALADGERDPRNLMVAFAIARVLLIEFDIRDKVEDFFNIVYCYFPISFRPPADDPNFNITPDDLRKALVLCLSATPAFGEPAIHQFLEKLNMGSPTVKRDVLQTMDVCLPVFGPVLARSLAKKTWNHLRLEIFQPTDPETEAEALKTLQVLIKTIYADANKAQDSEADIEGLAKEACEECIHILREPEKSQAKPAIKVICAFMSTTPSVSKFTLAQAVPHLIKFFLNVDEVANRGSVLSLLSSLVAAARDCMSRLDNVSSTGPPLLPYKDEVLGAFVVGLKVPSLASPSIEGLLALVTTPDLLEDEETGFVVQNVNDILSLREDISDTTDSTLTLLTTISSTAPHHVSETTLPLLFSALPDEAPPRTDSTARARYWTTLTSLSRLCAQSDLFETLVVHLTTKLDLLCFPTVSPPSEHTKTMNGQEEDPEPAAAYAHALLTTLGSVLQDKVDRGDVDVQKYIDRLVPRLFNLFICSTLTPSEDDTVKRALLVSSARLVSAAGRILNLIVQTLGSQRQTTFVKELVDAYTKGQVQRFAIGQQKISPQAHFVPFESTASRAQKDLVALFSEGITGLHKEVRLPVEDPSAFLNMILQWSCHQAENGLQRESVWHLLAAVVNKKEEDLNAFLSSHLDSFWLSDVVNTSSSQEQRRHALTAWTWVCKGLLVRNHPNALWFVNRLFELFDDDSISWDAARAIGAAIGSDKVLTKKNHAIIRILYVQKYTNALLPRIISGAKDASEPRQQTAHLVALTSLITSITKSVYAHEMPTLMPLLLRGLDLPDPTIRASVITTLLSAAQAEVEGAAKGSKEGSVFVEHAASLASIMLLNCSVDIMPDARVRIAALKFLSVLPQVVRYDVLHPQKAHLLRELSKVLDDPKRSVRKEAVDARTNWFTYNG